MYMYLISGENGWLRSVTLSVLDVITEMHGVLSTLHNVAGAMYVRSAAELPRDALDVNDAHLVAVLLAEEHHRAE